MALTHHWSCESPTHAVLIVHGMTEHLDCYASFSAWCVGHHVAVGGSNLPGHGPQARVLGDPGPEGWAGMLAAAYQSYGDLRVLYPDIPIVVLGHSMGSYVAQAMVAQYRPDIQGLVLSATSYEPRWVAGPSWVLAKVFGMFGEARPGRLFYDIIYGGFNTPFQPAKTPFDWLSRDPSFVARYIADPFCTFVPSVRLYSALFLGLYRLYGQSVPAPVVPMYVLSGSEDPLGKGLRSVMGVVNRYRQAGWSVETAFYTGGRHVMLAETNAERVYDDLYAWIISLRWDQRRRA
jgi:alpha-beta hydrolase superfamily lysophospholipase